MCVSERKRKTICVLSLSFCLSVRVDACLWILLSAPFNLSLAQVPCPFLLSQSFSSPRPPIHQFTPRAPPLSLPRHYFLLLPGSYIFRPLSTLRSPPFLCSLLSLGLRDLFLFYLSSYYVSQPSLCLTLPGFFSPSLSLISPLHTFPLAFSYQLVSVVFLSVSVIHMCPSIPCLRETFLASNLIMFSLVLQ